VARLAERRDACSKGGTSSCEKLMTSAPGNAASSSAGSARGPATILQAGQRAPEFALHSTPDQAVSLSDFRGRPVILAFYPADWSPVCGDQMALYNQVLPEFKRLGAELLGISVDGAWCHAAFASARNLHFPLLSDFEPKGEVARTYGAYRYQDGFCERALFVLDADGVIRWSYLSPVGVNPGADGILEALEAMHAGHTSSQPDTAGATS
jgi:peroxiredoxin